MVKSPSPRRVVALHQSGGRAKTAGEVRFIKDRGGDKSEWAWNSPGPNERDIGQDFEFNPRFLKPLAQVLRSTLMALGHATSAHSRMVKIKSRDISPDGNLGGKGYIQKIPDIRRQLMNCVEVLSAMSDCVYDEIRAPHWTHEGGKLDPRERQEIQVMEQEVKQIIDDPEGWAVEEEAEELEEAKEEFAKMAAFAFPIEKYAARFQRATSLNDLRETSEVLRGALRRISIELRGVTHE